MQITTFTTYSLASVLRANIRGFQVAGYTVKPGSSLNGLCIYARSEPRGKIVGYLD